MLLDSLMDEIVYQTNCYSAWHVNQPEFVINPETKEEIKNIDKYQSIDDINTQQWTGPTPQGGGLIRYKNDQQKNVMCTVLWYQHLNLGLTTYKMWLIF